VNAALAAILCSACGGSVAMEAGRAEPRCLFCGSTALQERALEEGVEPPQAHVPFAVSAASAASILHAFARKGFFRPGEFAAATIPLRPVYMTAWAWSALVETHWTALISAGTRSGKRPISGAEVQALADVLTPASSALSRAELAAVAPYSTNGALPIPEEGLGVPYEVGTLTRSVASGVAREQMKQEHGGRIAARVEARQFSGSALVSDLNGRPLLLPAWVGTFTYRGRLHRFVINGQTGKRSGTRPISPWRVLAAIAAAAIALGLALTLAN
jgi:hypothetical protein